MTKYKLIPLILTLGVAVAFDASARYKGDLNGDDRVDLADMVVLAKAIKAGSSDKSLDVNASGKIDDYDLQKLADIIMSGKLVEDTGMNVGIGGWDDDGEDYGGTVKAPAVPTRSAEATCFYLRDPKSEGDDTYSIEFGISYAEEAPCAILISINAPIDALKDVRLSDAVQKTHKIYGTPKMATLKYNEDYAPECVRFIIFSPDLKKIEVPDLSLGRIFYEFNPSPYEHGANFYGCQVIASGGMTCVDLPEHGSGFWGHWDPDGVDLIEDDSPCDIYTTDGHLLKKAVPASEIQYLDRGLYIIRQNGRSTKLLK